MQASPTLTPATWTNFGPGSYSFTGTASATTSVQFVGTGIDWTYLAGPNNGRARVAINGVVVATEDLYAPGYGARTKTFGGLPFGLHRIVITATGTKQAAATDVIATSTSFTIR
jgi:hypothetical protein